MLARYGERAIASTNSKLVNIKARETIANSPEYRVVR